MKHVTRALIALVALQSFLSHAAEIVISDPKNSPFYGYAVSDSPYPTQDPEAFSILLVKNESTWGFKDPPLFTKAEKILLVVSPNKKVIFPEPSNKSLSGIVDILLSVDKPSAIKLITSKKSLAQQARIESTTQVKTPGQKICRALGGTFQPNNSVTFMGQRYYDERTYNVNYDITAFTEASNGQKIQLRIAGIRFINPATTQSENAEAVNGDVVYKPNSVIWEDASLWKPCR